MNDIVNDIIDDLWIVERLLSRPSHVLYKGKVAEVVGYKDDKILMRQDGKNLATSTSKVKLNCSKDECKGHCRD